MVGTKPLKRQPHDRQQCEGTDQSVDYIVIGAGSAGCVLANRLTESGQATLALLEAGGNDLNLWVQMPIGYGKAFYHQSLNWRYVTEPVLQTDNRISYWPRGKVLGGSSSINAMLFVRGQAEDYDGWAALGNPGWRFKDVLPCFRRMEHNLEGADPWRGTEGPLTVTTPVNSVHPLCWTFLKAAEEVGLQRNPDFNGASQEGVGIYQITTRQGLRCSSAAAYLKPARSRENLRILTKAHVVRILFENRRAIGVEYKQANKLRRILARREVILSAGAVNSPQLLELSGIGDARRLNDLGIEVIRDTPSVGENLQDHIGVDYIYEANRPTLNNVLRPWWGRLKAGLKYTMTRDGPLSLSVNQAGGFFRSSSSLMHPNIQLYFSPLSYVRAVPGRRALMSPDPYPGLMIGISNCRPKSRGCLHISTPHAEDPPEIHPGYLSDPEDLAELLEGTRMLRHIASSHSLSQVVQREISPGAEVIRDEDLEADIRARCTTIFHPCGTCAMGPDPATSVVDPRLRVHGIEGLRVIDASIFPRIPTGNINAPTLMVAERGSDLILEDQVGSRDARASAHPSF